MTYFFRTAAGITKDFNSFPGVGIGITIVVFSVGALWIFLHLRDNTHARLHSIVGVAMAGLAEEALATLRNLQSDLSTLLPDPSEIVDPESVIVDPSAVAANAKKSINILQRRDQLPSQFQRLLVVCSCLKYASVTFTLSTLTTTFMYSNSSNSRRTWQGARAVTIGVLLLEALLLVAYSVLDSKIQKSIEVASSWKRS